MNKFVLTATVALAFGAFASTGPAFAQSSSYNGTNNSSQSAAMNATNTSGQSSPQQLVNDAIPVVRKIEADSHYAQLLQQSKGVFIMPNLVKGAFLIGGQGGQGVLLKHESNGTWSDPAFLTLGSVSLGAQAGGKAGPAVLILMTDKALNDFIQTNEFSLNANAGLTIINYSAQGQVSAGKGDIVVWSEQGGVFAGADVSGAVVTQSAAEDRAFYSKPADARQILAGEVSNPQVDKLKSALRT
jgi:SH3 domain-containing YSC84-like protein 1